jgi:hypothetical protein
MYVRNGVAVMFALAAMSIGAGCGSSESSSSDDATAATVTTNSDLTKAELIKQGDEICEETDKAQEVGLKAYTQKHPEAQSDEKEQSKMVIAVGLPPIQEEAEELAALGAPSGDEDEVTAIVEGIEGAVEKGEDDPGSLLAGSTPFDAVDKLAAEYGFQVCKNAL